MDATEPKEIALIEKFANAWMTKEVPNQPLRNNKSEAAIIGYVNYKDVKKDFLEHFFK